MDYPCASLVIVLSDVLVLSCGLTDRITDSHATIIGVTNYNCVCYVQNGLS